MAKTRFTLAPPDHPVPLPNPNTVEEPMPGMGMLCLADGVATPPAPTTDTLAEVLFYNDTNIGGTAPDPDTMRQNGGSANLEPIAGTQNMKWSISNVSGGVPPTTNPPTTAGDPNNVLYVLAGWDRDLGNAIFERIWDPGTGSPSVPAPLAHNYLGVDGTCNADKDLLKQAGKTKAASLLTAGIPVDDRDGHWLIYRDISAITQGQGHRLLNEDGSPLRASRISIYAFNVDWSYTYLNVPKAHQVQRRVQRSAGDIGSSEGDGLNFPFSTENSLVLWQASPFDRRRATTVIAGQSKSTAEVIDLSPNLGVFLHLNYQRHRPIRVEGTFGVAVRIRKK